MSKAWFAPLLVLVACGGGGTNNNSGTSTGPKASFDVTLMEYEESVQP